MYDLGEISERFMLDYFRAHGYAAELRNVSGGTEGRVHGQRIGGVTVHDIEATTDVGFGWAGGVEVKGKSFPGWRYSAGQWQHGVDEAAWQSCYKYRRHGNGFWIAFVEVHSPILDAGGNPIDGPLGRGITSDDVGTFVKKCSQGDPVIAWLNPTDHLRGSVVENWQASFRGFEPGRLWNRSDMTLLKKSDPPPFHPVNA